MDELELIHPAGIRPHKRGHILINYKPNPLPERLSMSLEQALAAYHADPTPERLQTVCDTLVERCASATAAIVLGLHERFDRHEAAHHGGD